ncbi:hypothetical protein [Methylobacterium aerolatum]|uniref:Uncharacterized protein n=1 Tax=Methylobacterium aerolatum TaxID=418708 RepID=A0ABU0HUR2_9HYPH|nr:hypothetical protein [Methylobacterium aerolatum]MDQ0445647.1 hypothetical protein [Methylobacterium aerolatum]GJD36244.1 hypothetical protein FMGBMHLM_3159 [Methylobacterium aerolatum]
MSRRPQARRLVLAALALGVTAGPASAFEDAFGQPLPYRERVIRRPVRALPPAIVSGYLPRNHNVPMYNEPPRRPAFGASWR